MDGALMQVCKCGKPNVMTGHAVCYDPTNKHWTLLVWPVREGNIAVYGIPNVAGCPVCLKPATKNRAVGAEQMPRECLDHLEHMAAMRKQAAFSTVGDGKPVEVVTPVEGVELPAPVEV